MGDASERYDQERQHYIESLGVHVIRFLNTDIYANIEAVVAKIKEFIADKSKPPLAPPS